MAEINATNINGVNNSSIVDTCGTMGVDDSKIVTEGDRVTVQPCTLYLAAANPAVSLVLLQFAIDFSNIGEGQRFWVKFFGTNVLDDINIAQFGLPVGSGFIWAGAAPIDPVVISNVTAQGLTSVTFQFVRKGNNVYVL